MLLCGKATGCLRTHISHTIFSLWHCHRYVYENFLTLLSNVHPRKPTWNLKITHLKRKNIFQTFILGFHVKFPGCMSFVVVSFLFLPFFPDFLGGQTLHDLTKTPPPWKDTSRFRVPQLQSCSSGPSTVTGISGQDISINGPDVDVQDKWTGSERINGEWINGLQPFYKWCILGL